MLRPSAAILAAILAALTLAVAACGDDETGAPEPQAGTNGEPACEPAEQPAPREVDLEKPPPKPSAPSLTAVVETTCGTFEVALATEESPKTAASFEHLARNGVFDGTWFHRIVPGFVVQGGDPAATGTGGPGYSVDEPPPQDVSYRRGTVAMAKTEAEPPGRSGSQFFVVTAADAGLPPQYAIAGEVTSGFDVVRTIEGYGDPASGGEGTPLGTVLIESVTIERG